MKMKQNWALSLSLVFGAIGCASLVGCHDQVHNIQPINPHPSANLNERSLIRSQFKKNDLTTRCNKAIADAKASLEGIASIAPGQRTFANTVLAFEAVTANLSDQALPLTFMGYVSKDKTTHDEGSQCEQTLGSFSVEINTRRDLYSAMKDQTPRNDQEKRLLTETLRVFELNGLKLSDDVLAQVKDLKQQLAITESQYSSNLNKDTSTVTLTKAQLADVPYDYVSTLKKTPTGSFVVPTRENDANVFLIHASNGGARKLWLSAYNNRQSETNTKLLEAAIILRQKIATLMGFQSWADYHTQGRMAKNATTVYTFLNSLKDKLVTRERSDIAKLLQFKKELDPSATSVEPWDINYLAYQLKKRTYNLDGEKIREYFPAEGVVAGMFDIYSKLLGVHFTEIKGAQVWSPDVKMYKIEDSQTNALIGYFYTDFVPRANKYGHAAAFPLISGRALANGSYSLPTAAIVANLNPPANGKPSLLSHDDVVTIFHEFGHIMHMTLTMAPYASLSGSNVAQDFVEAPSQMLENWPWDPTVLTQLSGHYSNHAKKLPADVLNRIIEARDFNQGYYYTRQLLLALLDMNFHTAVGAVDTTTVYNQMFTDILGIKAMEGTHYAASFGHLMGGYDAGYYGYLWSEVYAADMFTRFQTGGLLNPFVGEAYRRIILENGNMKDALELLTDFLGRAPNTDAFFKKLHL